MGLRLRLQGCTKFMELGFRSLGISVLAVGLGFQVHDRFSATYHEALNPKPEAPNLRRQTLRCFRKQVQLGTEQIVPTILGHALKHACVSSQHVVA